LLNNYDETITAPDKGREHQLNLQLSSDCNHSYTWREVAFLEAWPKAQDFGIKTLGKE